MSLKRDIFVNFLSQKIITKYGIVSTYSVILVSQKILVCLQCYTTSLLLTVQSSTVNWILESNIGGLKNGGIWLSGGDITIYS